MESNTEDFNLAMEQVYEICRQYSCIPIIGKCITCDSKDVMKAAIIKDCKIPGVDFQHQNVMVWLCGMCLNENEPNTDEIRTAIAKLGPDDYVDLSNA